MKMMMLWFSIPAPNMVKTLTPYCRVCANYGFMIEKRKLVIAEQSALELALDNSKIVGPVGHMQRSKHGEDVKEDCPSCTKVWDLRDGNAFHASHA